MAVKGVEGFGSSRVIVVKEKGTEVFGCTKRVYRIYGSIEE